MSGIIFFRTTQRERTVAFYTEHLGFETWLEQDAGCTILKRDNLLLGFCDGEMTESAGIVTVVVEDRSAVERLHEQLSDEARGAPAFNDDFQIYQFFLDDPDGRTVEIQTFDHDTPPLS